jgi:hypothetical protein
MGARRPPRWPRGRQRRVDIQMKLDQEGEVSRCTARFVASGPASTTVTPSSVSYAWLASAFPYHRRRHGHQIVSARNGHLVSICSHQGGYVRSAASRLFR